MSVNLCACGCGQQTTIAKHNSKHGAVKGQPLRFAPGHWNRGLPAAEIFWPKVERTPDSCWLWRGRRDKHGYGVYAHKGAHRFAYEQEVGPIPDGLEIDHLCQVRACVNPAHLEAVTHAENVRRTGERQTHCKHGHEYTEANTYTHRGKRYCRACGRSRQSAKRATRGAAA